MKKSLIPIALLTLLPLLLTSCDVHIGAKHWDVPWWYIAIPVAVFSAIVIIIGGVVLSKNEYRCKKCGHVFNPKWWQACLSLHDGSDRLIKCPECKKRGFCPKND